MERLFINIFCESTIERAKKHVVVKYKLIINDTVYCPKNTLIENPVYADSIIRIGDPTECIFIGDVHLAQRDCNSLTTYNYFCLN